MTQIQFYHLLSTPLERALPKLMEKAVAAEHRAIILVDSEAASDKLNDLLWSYNPNQFLPHGNAKTPYSEEQPIYIHYELKNPNQADILVITDGKLIEKTEGYDKILDIFNGHDEAEVSRARERWAHYSDKGYGLNYIKQQPNGGWKSEKTVEAKAA